MFNNELYTERNDIMSKINIVNLTPHTISLYNNDQVEVLKSYGTARCVEERKNLDFINEIPVVKLSYGEVYGLPEEKENTIYIVSYIVLRALNNSRNDVFTVTDTVRDNDGRIIGFRALSRL